MTSDIDQITSEYIEAYIADEVATKAAATAHQRYRGLKQLFAWLTDQGDIARDPMAGLRATDHPRAPHRHRRDRRLPQDAEDVRPRSPHRCP